ncbi:MAG: anti-sigma factor [Thermoleophilaceae bacterium]
MATLDTLPPQRRAIIELLLRQGQRYDGVASMLDMPPARVRELAREALSLLAPSASRRVDDEWRDQVADYVLGQQTGPESKATRGHLRRSQPARIWVSSVVDSLDPLYGDGDRPAIPGSGGATEPRRRRGGGGAAAAGAAGAAAGAGAATASTAGRRGATRPARESNRAATADAQRGAGTQERGHEETPGRTGALSPEARAVVRRRRIIGGAVAAGVVAVVLAIVLTSGGDEKTDRASSPPPPSQQQQGPQAQLVGQAELERVGRGDAQGVAVIARRGGEFQLLVQARGLEPSGRGSAYEVWLYNSRRDAQSLGGQVTDNDGSLQGAGPLPATFRSYRFVDISREKIDRNAGHSDDSVLRIPIPDLLRGRATAATAPGGTP